MTEDIKKSGRGMLTDDVQALAVELMGRQITLRELRMMPYIQYVMVSEREIDPNKMNGLEREVLRVWREERRISGGASGLTITKAFWDIINQLLWLGYANWDGASEDAFGEHGGE